MQRFKGKLLRLITQRRRLPNGYIADLEIIQHPGAVLIVPFLTRDKIILIKQYRPVINSTIYELPAGTLGRAERPIDCARREIIEEIGYCAEKFTKIGKLYPVPGYSTEVITIFKAERLKKKQKRTEPDEIIKTHVFRKDKVKYLFKKGKLVDSKTISALAFCGWL